MFIEKDLLKKIDRFKFYKDGIDIRTGEVVETLDRYQKYGWIKRTELYDWNWPNQLTAQKSIQSNIEQSQRSRSTQRKKFYGSQLTVTPFSKDQCCYTSKSIFGCFDYSSIRVDKMQYSFLKKNFIHQELKKNLKCNQNKFNWNIMVFDFIEFMPYLSKFLIGLNYKNYKLEITSLAIQKKSGNCLDSGNKQKSSTYKELGDDYVKVEDDSVVMKSLKDHIVEDNSLFILNFKEDLGLNFDEGQLALCYKYTEIVKEVTESTPAHLYGVAAFAFNHNTKFLLNMYNHQHHGQHWETVKEHSLLSPEKSEKLFKGEQNYIKMQEENLDTLAAEKGTPLLSKENSGGSGSDDSLGRDSNMIENSGLIIDGMVYPGKTIDQLDVISSSLVMEYKKDTDGNIDFNIH